VVTDDEVVSRLRADARAAGLDVPLDIVTVTRGDPGGEWDAWVPPGATEPTLVLVLDANRTALDARDRREVLAEAAGELQQLVVDLSGSPWPVDPGSGVVLEPGTTPDGDAVWTAPGVRPVPIGSLPG